MKKIIRLFAVSLLLQGSALSSHGELNSSVKSKGLLILGGEVPFYVEDSTKKRTGYDGKVRFEEIPKSTVSVIGEKRSLEAFSPFLVFIVLADPSASYKVHVFSDPLTGHGEIRINARSSDGSEKEEVSIPRTEKGAAGSWAIYSLKFNPTPGAKLELAPLNVKSTQQGAPADVATKRPPR
jgi:hypothetical protein